MFPANPAGIEVFFINLDLFSELSDIRHIDLDSAIAQSLHELVVLQLAILGLVGVTNDDLVNICLRKLLGLDLVFL